LSRLGIPRSAAGFALVVGITANAVLAQQAEPYGPGGESPPDSESSRVAKGAHTRVELKRWLTSRGTPDESTRTTFRVDRLLEGPVALLRLVRMLAPVQLRFLEASAHRTVFETQFQQVVSVAGLPHHAVGEHADRVVRHLYQVTRLQRRHRRAVAAEPHHVARAQGRVAAHARKVVLHAEDHDLVSRLRSSSGPAPAARAAPALRHTGCPARPC
jgi:hypothetical protein